MQKMARLLFATILMAAVSPASSLFFPESADPETAQPPLVRPNTKACVVPLFSSVACSSWDEVTAVPIVVPEDCSSGWSKIILDVKMSENGTQYDRFGAIWIGNIEVLRTTTAEPTAEGIEWVMEKDITVYGQYIRNTPNLFAYLAIPNNVDSTYTGIISVDASLTFYTTDEKFPEVPVPFVQPLTSATSSSDPFTPMTVIGNQALLYSVSMPVKNVEALFLDVYASPHGCEEFYYTNVPSEEASSIGLCGGGVYREIQVFIDESFAGSTLPFPVIYTGGINPFLWRPLTGIMSFDIPSHRFDLSPFLALLSDGLTHNISITVLGNNDAGYWYLDACLLYSQGNKNLVGGYFLDAFDSGVKVATITNRSSPNLCFHTTGNHSYRISSSLQYDDGSILNHSVGSSLYLDNENCIFGTTLMKTAQLGLISAESRCMTPDGMVAVAISNSKFPLMVESYYMQDETTFDMQATVIYSYEREKVWKVERPNVGDLTMSLTWSNSMASNATYNRTLDHTTVYAELNRAQESFQISHIPWNDNCESSLVRSSCFSRVDSASDGYVTREEISGVCAFPSTMSFCGYDVCGALTLSGYQSGELRSAKGSDCSIEGATSVTPPLRSNMSKRQYSNSEQRGNISAFVRTPWSAASKR